VHYHFSTITAPTRPPRGRYGCVTPFRLWRKPDDRAKRQEDTRTWVEALSAALDPPPDGERQALVPINTTEEDEVMELVLPPHHRALSISRSSFRARSRAGPRKWSGETGFASGRRQQLPLYQRGQRYQRSYQPRRTTTLEDATIIHRPTKIWCCRRGTDVFT